MRKTKNRAAPTSDGSAGDDFVVEGLAGDEFVGGGYADDGHASHAEKAPRRAITGETLETPTIGMYQAKTGTRTASGVTVFVQETVDRLATHNQTYLYTEAGAFADRLDDTDAEIVSFEKGDGLRSVEEILARLPASVRVLPAEISETISSFASAVQDGVINHIEENVDILLTHNLVDTALLSNAVSVPVVRVCHTYPQVGLGTKVLAPLSNTAAVISNSRRTARGMSERLGRESEGIAYPGVDIQKFDPGRTPAFETDDVAVLFVGRFVADKGVYDLLEAFAETTSDAHLYLVGRGDEQRIERRIADLGIEESVTVEGPVAHERLPHYYTAADVVCLPSHHETFGLVNLEAMASGRAVLTSNIEGIQEYATHGETGLLVPPGEPDRLAEALDELCSSPELRRGLGENAREVAEQYSWQSTAAELSRLCEEILD